jgi:aldose 1-epimerase
MLNLTDQISIHAWTGEKMRNIIVFLLVILLLPSFVLGQKAGQKKRAGAKMNIKQGIFGKTSDGQQVDLYILTNKNGLEARIITFGGTLVSMKVPDKTGKLNDIVLGHDNVEGYEKNSPYFGCLVGRYANRIAKGRFTLNGVEYKLATNNGANHLHGGLKGFDKVVWKAEKLEGKDNVGLKLTYLSRDGEEGYPGNLQSTVTYRLTDDNELKIDYLATTDKDTVINLTNHSYFNLSGEGDILGHHLKINADRFTPIDEGLIPTGELKNVADTPMDFTLATPIGQHIDQKHEQLVFGKGYDHNWVLNRQGTDLALAAEVYEPKTGRVLQVYTTEPGIQFYSGNFLDGTIKGKGGRVYEHRNGFCLETQHFPDSPNKPNFPSVILKPGKKYTTSTIYKFSVR